MTPEKRSQIKKTANMLERTLARELNCRRIPMSGAIPSWKGDLESDRYLIDSKNTEKPMVLILASDLAKINTEAREAGKEAGHLILTFLPDYHFAVVPTIDCDFDSTQEYTVAGKSHRISKSILKSMVRRGKNKNAIPSFRIVFEKMRLGCPKDWLVIPLEIYKEHFTDE